MRARVGAGAAVGTAAVLGTWTLRRRHLDQLDRQQAEAAHRPADVGFMRAMHGAMRRDLDLLRTAARAPGPAAPKVWEGWQLFRRELESHHRAEDEDLWPVLRDRLSDPDDLRVVDAMYEEHRALPGAINAAAVALQQGAAPVAVDALIDAVGEHLAHEEAAALPLVEAHLTDAEWHRFLDTERRAHSPRERGEFLMWVMAGAQPEHADAVMRELPPPGRFVYRNVLRHVHDRRRLWQRDEQGTDGPTDRRPSGLSPVPA